MSFKCTCFSESLATLAILVCFLPVWIILYIFLRTTASEKKNRKGCTGVFLFHQCESLNVFSVSMKKILGTLATLIWLFTSMSTYVFLRSEVLEEVLSHWLHWCGLSPVWVIIWVLRLLVWENTFSQWVHWYGFSLVWVLICLFSVLALGKAFPYWLHWCGFSPVWVIICLKTLITWK